VQWYYRQVGISIPRTTAAQGKYYVDNGLTVSSNDLVFFSHDTNGRFILKGTGGLPQAVQWTGALC